ncbi:unnamed protein product [Prunus armeniaca]
MVEEGGDLGDASPGSAPCECLPNRGENGCRGARSDQGYGLLGSHREVSPFFLSLWDMYLTLVRAEKEVALARRHSETAKATTVGSLERELKETTRRLEAVEEASAEAKTKKGQELASACSEAVEEYKGSDDFKNLVLDAMVEEQFGWEKLVARFNPDLDINFDTSGLSPPIPPGRDLLFVSPSSADATSPPNAEARGGAEVNEGESIPEPEPTAEKAPEEHADA